MTVCEKNMCAGCMACVDMCSQNAIRISNKIDSYNAIIDETKCINCSACINVCQRNHPATVQEPILWYQGWAKKESIRENASSGGVASEITRAFVKSGGCVFSCVFKFGEFKFEIAESLNEVSKFASSKYVKSNPEGIYREIRERLKKQKVLFIGLPCQVAAVKNFVETKQKENLYTIDLICHGTPATKLLQLFLDQYGYDLSSIENIDFRTKTNFQIIKNKKTIGVPGTCDKYTLAFLNSISYTENCYDCMYAKIQRVSDITLGDSWGSELSIESQRAGISLILCQTDRGKELIDISELHLESVNIEKAIQNNHQLIHPSIKPKKRALFFAELARGNSFNNAVIKCYPKSSFKQFIKGLLIRTRLWGQ